MKVSFRVEEIMEGQYKYRLKVFSENGELMHNYRVHNYSDVTALVTHFKKKYNRRHLRLVTEVL